MEDNAEKHKHATMLPNTIRANVCGHPNCDQRSHKLVGKSARRTFREHICIFEIVAIAKILIFGEFVVVD